MASDGSMDMTGSVGGLVTDSASVESRTRETFSPCSTNEALNVAFSNQIDGESEAAVEAMEIVRTARKEMRRVVMMGSGVGGGRR